MKRLLGLLIFLNGLLAYSQPERMSRLNLDHFSARQKNTFPEFQKLIPRKYLDHPELGIKPFDGPPCIDCFELVDRRDESSRYYVVENSGGSSFILQKASGPINYLDGRTWKEINYRLERKSDKIFIASHQPQPVRIDLGKQEFSIQNLNYNFKSRLPVLLIKNADGSETSPGIPDFSHYTAGDDGIRIINVYPGIDLVISVRRGEVETSYVINKKLQYSAGELIFRQQMVLPPNLFVHDSQPSHNQIYISGIDNVPYFNVEMAYAYDNAFSGSMPLMAGVNANTLDVIVPFSWLSDPSTVYPVVIDPIVTTQNTVPVAGISGTRYGAACWTNSCDNAMTVPTPPNVTITGIYHSFEFYATGLCYADDGGYSIDYLGCHAPAAAPGVYTNSIHISNAFFTAINVVIPEFNACLPPPQCATQNLNFTLHFFRCNHDPDTTCNGNCIRATAPWTMFVEGHTVEVASITGTQQICQGTSTVVVVAPQYGVGPYAYSWTPGGTDDSLAVTPATSTTYSVTITDACGETATGASIVNVTTDNNPGFTINPNPACVNVAVTFTGNGAGPAANYDWFLPGSSAPGGIVNDTQAPNVSYSVPGHYNAILSYANGVCVFDDTLPLTVSPLAATAVAITAQPPGAICQGDTVTFHANIVNGGTAPTYDWFIDGVNVQSGATDSLVTFALVNGSQVDMVLHSNAFCSAPLVDTATLFVAVANALVPVATISPDTAVCPGSAITLNASNVNGGATPGYQWFANGVPIPGATSSSYSFNVTPPDTIISVVIASSLTCVSTPVAIDSTIINVLVNIMPVVTLNANPTGTICAGDSIHYTAHAVYGGNAPQFQWYVNGVLSGINDSVFTVAPSANDSVSVQLTSSLTCVAAPTDDDYLIANVASAVSPAVAVSVSPAAISCSGDTVTFTASAVNAGSTPTFQWTLNGNPVGINDSVFTSSSLNDNDQLQVILISSLSCAPVSSDTDFVSVTVVGNVAPTVSVATTGGALCEGDSVTLVAAENNGGPTPVFQWYINGAQIANNNDTLTIAGLNNGDSVSVEMTSSLACVAPSVVMSSQFPVSLTPMVMPQVTLTSNPTDTICIGQSITIQANIQNGGSAPVLNWYVNSILSPVTSTVINSSTFVPGDVIVANLISNADCLLQPDDTSNYIRILYHQPLSIQLFSSPPDCPGNLATVYAQISGGSGGPYHTVWSDGSVDADSITVIADKNTRVQVQVEDNCTVLPAMTTYAVPVLIGPVAEYAYQNPSPGSFQNNIQFINLSTDADTWVWYFVDENVTSTDLTPLHQFPEEGTYDVKLVTENNNGCTDTVLYNVTVKEEIAVFYPNSFTPNGDGRNDFFQPIGASLEEYELTIWDRWGEQIYKGNSQGAWTGNIKNSSKPAPEGVYIFRIDLMDEKFQDRIVLGRVTLVI